MTRNASSGFALPLLVLALFGAGTVWAMYAMRLPSSFDRHSRLQTETALRVARDALIGYAASGYADKSIPNDSPTPGTLPCPDTKAYPGEARSCSAGTIGRVPWKTLGIDPPRDGSGECLWYALSDGAHTRQHVENRSVGGNPPAINPGWPGTFPLHDHATGAKSVVIAVLIAPGSALKGQARTLGDRCNTGEANDYLESLDGYNNASGASAVRAARQPGFNDTVLPITSKDLYNAIAPRVLLELAGSNDFSGLRQLLREFPTQHPPTAPTEENPTPPSWVWYLTPEGRLMLNFLNEDVRKAFPAPQGGTSDAESIGNCTHYVKMDSTPGRSPDSADGTFSIEWLCFNQWTSYTLLAPRTMGETTLTIPILGWQASWQANAISTARTQLRRVHNG